MKPGSGRVGAVVTGVFGGVAAAGGASFAGSLATGGVSGGPLPATGAPRVTVNVFSKLSRLTTTLTASPAFLPSRAAAYSLTVSTFLPSTNRIVSPTLMPAFAAGPSLARTLITSLSVPSCTPMIGVGPAGSAAAGGASLAGASLAGASFFGPLRPPPAVSEGVVASRLPRVTSIASVLSPRFTVRVSLSPTALA